MLDIMKKLDAGTIRGLIVATIPLLVLIASFFGLDEAVVGAKLSAIGEKVVALFTLGGIAWAAYARLYNPTPPITETAAQKTQDMIQKQQSAGGGSPVQPPGKQGGYIQAGILGLILALSVAGTAALVLPGCAALGLQAPQGFNEKVAAGYTGLTGVREATLALLQSNSISADEAQKVQDKADEVRAALDSAATLKGVDFKQAENRLTSAIQVLITLQDFVAGRRQGKQVEVPR